MISIIVENEKLNLEYGINSLIIKNKECYRKLYFEYSEYLSIMEDSTELSPSKILIIKDILNISLNDKKNIAYLYKLIIKSINEKYSDQYHKIMLEIKTLLLNLIDENELNVELDDEDNNKLFQTFNLRYKEEDEEYLFKLSNYLNMITLISNHKLIITYNLTMVLSEEELENLNKELNLKQIILLDISTNIQMNNIQNIYVIDEQCCII